MVMFNGNLMLKIFYAVVISGTCWVECSVYKRENMDFIFTLYHQRG